MSCDPAIALMEAAAHAYSASVKLHKERQMAQKCYKWITDPMPTPQLTYQPREIARAVLTDKLLSKAAQVRAKISQAKRKHQSHNTVVEWAINTLSMTRGQANRYVTENWPRS